MPKKLTHDEFITKLAKENPTIEVLSPYSGNKQYITVRCKLDGTVWQTKPNWLKAGRGCQTCYDNRRGKTRVKGVEKFIEEAHEVHGDKYDYSKVVYINDTEKVCLVCRQHGEFWISPTKHLRDKQGCPTCGRRRIDTTDFIQKAKLIHGDRYDYSKTTYQGRFVPTTIICPIHGEFLQKPDKHLSAHGCPLCKESKCERSIREMLKSNNIHFEAQKQFPWLGKQTLDFYLPEYNIAIECQGEQHFHPVSIYKGEEGFQITRERDLRKYQKCLNNNVKVLYHINVDKEFIPMPPYDETNVFFSKDLTHFNEWLG